jgi:dienelactone hydrolase
MDPAARPEKRKRRRAQVVLLVVAVGVALAWRPVETHLRAASLLLRFEGPGRASAIAAIGAARVDEGPAPFGDTDARLYTPRGAVDPPGLVIVHGVHRLGIDEPRLVRFSRAIASLGIRVLTPEVRELADYRIDPRSIETIGAAARALRARTSPRREVGVMGMSFAGGLSLLAAADPRFASDIDFVVSIGGHDDVARVSRFFATNTIPEPDGTILSMQAHEYGPLVLVYAHVEDFFPPEDVAAAREALRLWLWEDQGAARERAGALTASSRERMGRLFDHHVDAIAPELLAMVDRHAASMAAVSPHDRLGSVEAPVYLLHGAGDAVIPPSEALWLGLDVPARALRAVLVTRAIQHVEPGERTSLREEWLLVHFLAQILAQEDAARETPQR